MGAAGAPGLVLLDERVEEPLARMTIGEKVAQLGGAWFRRLLTGDDLDDEKLEAALGGGIGHITCMPPTPSPRRNGPPPSPTASNLPRGAHRLEASPTYGEDPELASGLAVAFVRGLQATTSPLVAPPT